FKAVADDEAKIVVVPRFLDELIKTDVVDRLDGVFLVRVSSQKDPRYERKSIFDVSQESDAIHFRHEIVGDGEIDVGVIHFQVAQGLLRRRVGQQVITTLDCEKRLQRIEDHLFVIHQKN